MKLLYFASTTIIARSQNNFNQFFEPCQSYPPPRIPGLPCAGAPWPAGDNDDDDCQSAVGESSFIRAGKGHTLASTTTCARPVRFGLNPFVSLPMKAIGPCIHAIVVDNS